MNTLVFCALLLGGNPEKSIDPTFAPKLNWTIPAVGSDNVGNATVVAISADGALVAGGFDAPVFAPAQLAVYDRKTGNEIYRAAEDVRGYGFVSMAFSRDNRYLAVGTYLLESDFGGGVSKVQLIDLKEKKRVKSWYEKAFAFSPTEELLYLTAKTHIEVLELPGLKVVRKIAVPFASRLAVSADGKTVAALHKTELGQEAGWRYDDLAVIAAGTGVITLKYNGFSDATGAALAFSPDGKRIATGHFNGEARVWSAVKEGKPQRFKIETPFALFPLWFDDTTLVLFTQRRPLGTEKQATWADMYRCDLSRAEPEAIRWRFENAMGQPFAPNSQRYALSADKRRLVAACNGMSVLDLAFHKMERTFPGWKALEPTK